MTSGRHVCLDKTKPDMTKIDKTSKYYCTIPQMTMDPENFRSPSWHETQRNHHLIHCETTSIWRFPKMGWGYHIFFGLYVMENLINQWMIWKYPYFSGNLQKLECLHQTGTRLAASLVVCSVTYVHLHGV